MNKTDKAPALQELPLVGTDDKGALSCPLPVYKDRVVGLNDPA